MALLFNNSAFRALLLALVLAGVAAIMAPTARGAENPAGSRQQAAGSEVVGRSLPAAYCLLPAGLLAEEWSWSEFIKFWKSQMGSMNGVVGTVLLVGAAAVVMILWKGK